MDDRVYILLDVVGGKAEQVARLLRESRGVVMADVLEGPPDVIMLVKAAERQQLAKLAIQALTSVETMTENFLLLPARDRSGTNTYPKSSYGKRKKVI
jgi:hypothetical protein